LASALATFLETVALLATSPTDHVLQALFLEDDMFGNKQAKKDNLKRLVRELRSRGEMTTGELAHALQVSQDAIEDYLVSLEEHNVKLCQKGRKISLAEWWTARK
jgi:transcription initiation factor IIE alpha subunit